LNLSCQFLSFILQSFLLELFIFCLNFLNLFEKLLNFSICFIFLIFSIIILWSFCNWFFFVFWRWKSTKIIVIYFLIICLRIINFSFFFNYFFYFIIILWSISNRFFIIIWRGKSTEIIVIYFLIICLRIINFWFFFNIFFWSICIRFFIIIWRGKGTEIFIVDFLIIGLRIINFRLFNRFCNLFRWETHRFSHQLVWYHLIDFSLGIFNYFSLLIHTKFLIFHFLSVIIEGGILFSF